MQCHPYAYSERLHASASTSIRADQPNSRFSVQHICPEKPGCPACGRGDANGDVACKAFESFGAHSNPLEPRL
eukprot:1319255-Pyramimonas_sp.AAC.1